MPYQPELPNISQRDEDGRADTYTCTSIGPRHDMAYDWISLCIVLFIIYIYMCMYNMHIKYEYL